MKTSHILKIAIISALAFAGAACTSTPKASAPKKVLVVSVTAGFRHTEAIDASKQVLPKLAQQSGAFTLDWCDQPAVNPPQPPRRPANATAADEEKYQQAQAKFKEAQAAFEAELKKALLPLSPDNLKKYDAIIFNNTTGDLPLPDRDAFIAWVKSGKGFIGIHAATDTYHNYPPYIDMIGAEFRTHGAQATVDALNQDPSHAACKNWGPSRTVHDEIYLVKNFDPAKVHGLLHLDKHPNTKEPGDYPIAWCKAYGQGRVFYTALGHRGDVWNDDTPANEKRSNSKEISQAYQQHLLGGILWTLGLQPGSAALPK
jgi:type 1 glutamine amidotransferase